MEQSRYISAAIVSIAIVLFGVLFSYSANNFSKLGSYVEVKGLSEKIVKADTATWTIGFDVKSNDINSLYAEVEKNKTIIENFLVTNGFDKSEMNMAPINIYQDTYKEALFRYNGSAQFSLYTKKVDAVKAASKNTLPLLQKGVVMTSSNVNFEFTDINSIKPAMLSEAIQNAQASASEFAKASGARVGGIERANQGVIDISEKDPGSPEYKKIRVVSTVRYILR